MWEADTYASISLFNVFSLLMRYRSELLRMPLAANRDTPVSRELHTQPRNTSLQTAHSTHFLYTLPISYRIDSVLRSLI